MLRWSRVEGLWLGRRSLLAFCTGPGFEDLGLGGRSLLACALVGSLVTGALVPLYAGRVSRFGFRVQGSQFRV